MLQDYLVVDLQVVHYPHQNKCLDCFLLLHLNHLVIQMSRVNYRRIPHHLLLM